MLKTIEEASKMIESGQWLHISGNENLLKQLPKGNWIGGSIEYFMSEEGGVVTNQKLFINEIPSSPCKISIYDVDNIENITKDAFENGFSIIILPFDSEILKVYAKNAPSFQNIFFKNIVGWVAGTNLSVSGQTPIVLNGQNAEVFYDKAVVMHVSLPEDSTANIGIINIFTPDENSPILEFSDDTFSPKKCLIDGNEVVLSDYLIENNIDTKIPIIGEYYSANINTSFYSNENGIVHFGSPVFKGIKYRFANAVSDYPNAFKHALEQFSDVKATFACNCLFNFLYGEMEGTCLDYLHGPMTFGEVAYQLVNQTLVYLIIV